MECDRSALEKPPVAETTNQPEDRAAPQPQSKRGRWRWQFGLRSLILLTATMAVWLAVFVNRHFNATLETRIQAMRPLAHVLEIDDPNKFAIVRLEEYWYDDHRWDLYLPEGQYQLCLATREIDDTGLAPVVKRSPIAAGRHQLSLEQQRNGDAWHVNVGWDGQELLAVDEPNEWDAAIGSSGGSEVGDSEQQPASQPLIVFRRRFTKEIANGQISSPIGPAEGILLWIEKASDSKSGH
jgi:hypothetical protein